MERTQLRIVAGRLRGRKLVCAVHAGMRPTPQRVREALFSILGDAVPDRPFYDVFAGTGVVGLEAISRGASRTVFVERDFKLADRIDEHLRHFGVASLGQLYRTDVYRWAERGGPTGTEPVTVFLSPPFDDLTHRPDDFLRLVTGLHAGLPPGSVLVIQAEGGFAVAHLPDAADWDVRQYGRNLLLFWVKPTPTGAAGGA